MFSRLEADNFLGAAGIIDILTCTNKGIASLIDFYSRKFLVTLKNPPFLIFYFFSKIKYKYLFYKLEYTFMNFYLDSLNHFK